MPFYATASESGIEQLLHADTEIHPPTALAANARLRDYAGEYARSVEHPEAFWVEVGQEVGDISTLEE